MPTKPKLPKLLKALLALHGVCASFLFLYAALLLAISILTNGVPFPVLAWWIPNTRGFIDVWYYVAPSYADALWGSLFEFLGFFLVVAYIIFRQSLHRRRKSSIPMLCIVAASELGVIISWMYNCWENRGYLALSFWIAFWSMAVLLPFAAAIALTCFCLNPIKAHLEARS